MPFTKGTLSVKQSDIFSNFWTLTEDLVYQGRDETFTIEKHFPTDFASVPQIMQWLVPRTGKYSRAVVVHDFLCDSLFSGNSPVSARDADGIFRRILREERVPFVKRWLMWTGVRWGALFNRVRRPGIWRDVPLVTLLSLLALPLVLPAGVGVLLGLALYWVIELLVTIIPRRSK